MLKIRKILVPTDFSEESIFAYTHAQELAQKYGARVDLLHIVPLLKYFKESFDKLGVPLNVEEDLYPHVKDGAKHRLEGLMEDYLLDENRGECIVLIDRKPAKAIAEYAGKNDYDLVVMAARGEHGSDLFRGGVTERVIRYSDVPVFSVDSRLKPDGLNRILVPTDASSVSFSCFPMALTLAETYGADLTLFHVLELYGTLSESIPRDPDKSDQINIYESIIEGLSDYLIEEGWDDVLINRKEEDFADEIVITEGTSKKTFPMKTVIERGVSAHYEIERYAPGHADLIVMTTHGHSGLAHFLLGSTTEKVALHVDMPVVTVKPSKEKLSE